MLTDTWLTDTLIRITAMGLTMVSEVMFFQIIQGDIALLK